MSPIIRLHPGEQILLDLQPSRFWTLGKYVTSLGLWAVWRGRHHFYITNHRVVECKGIVSKVERVVPLERIQDCQLVRSLNRGGWVQISTAGGPLGYEGIGPLTRGDARRFADTLMPLLVSGRGT